MSLQTINWVALPNTEAESPCATVELEDILDAACGAGFKHIGVDMFTLEQQSVDVEVLAEMLAARGLRCTDLGVLAVSAQDGCDEAQRIGRMASRLGATVCVTVLVEPPTPAVLEQLRQCGQILGAHGVIMALEFLPYGPVATLEDCIAVCQQVGWSRCAVLLDTWHFFHNPPAWDHLAQMDSAHIALVQVNDAPPPMGSDLVHESRFRRVPPGDGTFDLDKFVQTLHTIGYRGIISPEVLSTALREQPPHDVAQTLYDATLQTGILR